MCVCIYLCFKASSSFALLCCLQFYDKLLLVWKGTTNKSWLLSYFWNNLLCSRHTHPELILALCSHTSIPKACLSRVDLRMRRCHLHAVYFPKAAKSSSVCRCSSHAVLLIGIKVVCQSEWRETKTSHWLGFPQGFGIHL